MELLAEIVNSFQSFTIFTSSILDIWQGSEYTSNYAVTWYSENVGNIAISDEDIKVFV